MMPTSYAFPSEEHHRAHVRAVFDRVATRYDLMNDVMSFGLHRRWKHIMAERVLPVSGAAGVRDILDMASGSGDIALRLLALAQTRRLHTPLHITLCDPNPDMLAQAQRRIASYERANGWQGGRAFEEGVLAEEPPPHGSGASLGTPPPEGNLSAGEAGASFVQRPPEDYLSAGEAGASFVQRPPKDSAKRAGGRAKDKGGFGGVSPPKSTRTSMHNVGVGGLPPHEKRLLHAGCGGRGDSHPPTRPHAPHMQLVQAEAEHPPFKEETFDAYTIAFGLRNVADMQKALCAARHLLRPGGRFFCLEFSQPHLPGLAPIYAAYGDHIIPRIGKTIVGDAAPYRYLIESIRRFPPPARITAMLEEAGFSHIACERLSGGIVALHRARKI